MPTPEKLSRDTYDGTLRIRDALQLYFHANGFSADGGYNDKWVKFRVGPFYVIFPNIQSRVNAVRFHDIHHIVTGYRTNFVGEGEIGAWELGSGCSHFKTAWYLNGTAFAAGVFFSPKKFLRAYVRGLHTKNLYDARAYDDTLLSKSVTELQHELGTFQADCEPTSSERVNFYIFSLKMWFLCGLPLLLVYTVPIFLIWRFVF